jgi:peroxiredoxin
MTVEPSSGEAGLDDFANDDWKVRSLACRDLVRAGLEQADQLVTLLGDTVMEVRYLAALALGVLEERSAREDLERLLLSDEASTVRSQAAISLGQLGDEGSRGILERLASEDDHRDVAPQCRIAANRITRHGEDQSRLREAFLNLDESQFRSLEKGDRISHLVLPDVDGNRWSLEDHLGKRRVVLLWVFADWCPVCHHEFHDLISFHDAFEGLGVELATVECHDSYRCRVMAGREPKPEYWFSRKMPPIQYGDERWWPHLMDFAGAQGARLGVDPLCFAVHSEFVNRPSTVVIDPDGTIRMAYHGTFWGDRPTIEELLGLLRADSFEFKHPKRARR